MILSVFQFVVSQKSPFLLHLSRMFARRKKYTYWEYAVNCTGNEAHLSSCKLGQVATMKTNGTCAGGLPVVVSCVPGRAFAPTSMTGFRKAFRQEVTLPRKHLQVRSGYIVHTRFSSMKCLFICRRFTSEVVLTHRAGLSRTLNIN